MEVSMLSKVYHIYSGDTCLHANLNEDSFNGLWEYYFHEQVPVEYEVCDTPRELLVEEASY